MGSQHQAAAIFGDREHLPGSAGCFAIFATGCGMWLVGGTIHELRKVETPHRQVENGRTPVVLGFLSLVGFGGSGGRVPDETTTLFFLLSSITKSPGK
jgi:hypothetical protein